MAEDVHRQQEIRKFHEDNEVIGTVTVGGFSNPEEMEMFKNLYKYTPQEYEILLGREAYQKFQNGFEEEFNKMFKKTLDEVHKPDYVFVGDKESLQELLDKLDFEMKMSEAKTNTEDKPSKDGILFQMKLPKSWWKPKVGHELVEGVQVHSYISNTRITQYPQTPAESIPSCGQRYERENQSIENEQEL
ncbi:MAG: hypothetical protein ABFD07_01210 [Methanobacterium sp.]